MFFFKKTCWVSVDPVTGVLQPYSAENAFQIEERFHLHQRAAQVSVTLPSGAALHVTIRFDYETGRHTQTTGRGLRSVSRICCSNVTESGRLKLSEVGS